MPPGKVVETPESPAPSPSTTSGSSGVHGSVVGVVGGAVVLDESPVTLGVAESGDRVVAVEVVAVEPGTPGDSPPRGASGAQGGRVVVDNSGFRTRPSDVALVASSVQGSRPLAH